jgi:RHS repeat-associated protein
VITLKHRTRGSEIQGQAILAGSTRTNFLARNFIAAMVAAILLLLSVAASASATVLPGSITENMTLTPAKSPYTGSSTIQAGVTVIAEPGTVLKVGALTVKGTLKAEGTAGNPIVFTSAKEEAAGEWKNIIFEPGSGASVLDYVEVKFGGEKLSFNPSIGAVEVNASAPRISNSTFRNNKGYGIRMSHGGSPEIANNKLFNNGEAAISYTSNTGDSGEIKIHGNYVEGGPYGIGAWVFGSAAVTAKTLSANTVVGSKGIGLSYSGPEVPGDVTENTLTGNASNYIQISGTVAHSSTWNSSGTAVKVEGGLTIAASATLKITQGVYLMKPNMTVKGTLLAEGTAEEPVVFTGVAQTTPGEWGNIKFEPGSGASVLDHVIVAYGGDPGLGSTIGAVEVNSVSPTIEHSTFLRNQGYGVRMSHGGAPDVADNSFFENGGVAISYTSTTGESGDVNISGNDVLGGSAGILVNVFKEAKVTATALSGNVVIGTEGNGLKYNGSSIPGDITENTLEENQSDSIIISGTVASSSTWNDGGSLVKVEGEVVVASGVTLRITKGVTLISPKLSVKGTLLAEGTSAEPVIFTGPKQEASGEWGSITFTSTSTASVFDHVEVAYGGSASSSGMIEAQKSSPTITNSTIRKAKYYGIKVTESGAPKIEGNRFRGNASGGLSYTGTGNLSAPSNDWGCASGPKPAGCGDAVTSNVKWQPAVQLPELGGHCRGKESQCPEGADPVDLATGQLAYYHRDLLLTNKGSQPLEFARSYSSGSSADTGLGPGWSQTGLASASELASGEVLVVRQDGRQDSFQKTESGYKAPSGVTDALAKVEGSFQLTTLEGTVYRFDSSGRIASITDDHGLKTTYGYNAEGRLATITDPSAQTLTFSYNGSNHITLVKDSTGREVKFAYSAAGDLETATDALGGVTKYAYDSQHRLTSITDPRGNVILKNTYDGQGRIVEQRDGLEDLWKLEYKAGETIVTEPRGGQLKYGFDSQSRVVSETDQLGHTTTTGYDAAGNVDEVLRPGGAKWSLGHDAAGNLTSIEDPEGGERSFEYDSKNRLTHSTDARGNSWSYEWSASNDLTKLTDPEGGETTFTYNASGQPLTQTDPDKHKSEFSWDTRGNPLSTTDPLGHKTSFEFNSRNYLTAKALPGLKAEALERNALGDLLARTTPEGHKTKYAYDANGLPTQVTDPAEGVWKIERNAMERPTTYIDPLGKETKVTYDGNLRPVKVLNRRGKETTYAYDLANQLTEVKRPEGGSWEYGYDSRGNRSAVVDPRGNEATYGFDLLDRMTEADEPLSVSTEYGYDPNGDLTSVKDPRGNTTSYAYDKLGRLTEIAQPLEKSTTYTYDPAGNQLTRTTALGTVESSYDAANRLTAISSGESALRSYGYDAADRRTSATDAEGHKIEIAYTEEGRPSSIKDGRGQSLTRSYDSRGNLTKQIDGRGTIDYGYDKLSRMTSLTDPQGKSLGFGYDPEGDLTEVTRPNSVTTTNLYNDAGRLAETVSKTAEPLNVLESLKYTYDNAGNATSRVDQRLEQETSYSYDALNRLTEFNPPGEGATTYDYDAAGNRTEAGGTTYAFNALNQPTESSTGATYSYDGAGRLTAEVNGSEETTFAWDPFDHPAKVEGPGGSVTYSFDGLERLSERKSGEAAKVFHYGDLGDMTTYTANGEGKTTASYVQGAHGLAEQRSGEATSFSLLDGHGDVTAVSSPGGEVESRQSFDPWGDQLSGPSLEMGYLGAWERPSDTAGGMVQMGARSYAPALGAFASEDPVLGHLGIGVSVNRYPYAWDNPLNRYDLNGRDVCVFGACAEDAADAADDAWEASADLITHPGEAATNAVNYWAESESPVANIFGPLATLGDMAINPDRVGYYLEKVTPAQLAATGTAAAATVGFGGLTVTATGACLFATPELEAVHVCSFIAGTGASITGAAGVVTIEAARR